MADDASILAQRNQLVNDLYTEGASMLEGMGKKRKLGSKKNEEEDEEKENDFSLLLTPPEDPVSAAFKEQDQILDDQDVVLADDPAFSEVSKIKKLRVGNHSAWKRKIYEAAKRAAPGPFSATGNDVGQVATGLWQNAMGNAGAK